MVAAKNNPELLNNKAKREAELKIEQYCSVPATRKKIIDNIDFLVKKLLEMEAEPTSLPINYLEAEKRRIVEIIDEKAEKGEIDLSDMHAVRNACRKESIDPIVLYNVEQAIKHRAKEEPSRSRASSGDKSSALTLPEEETISIPRREPSPVHEATASTHRRRTRGESVAAEGETSFARAIRTGSERLKKVKTKEGKPQASELMAGKKKLKATQMKAAPPRVHKFDATAHMTKSLSERRKRIASDSDSTSESSESW
jgi:hypothetical protein